MKTIQYFFISIIACLMMLESCKKDSSPSNQENNYYFPLRLGNSWQFENSPQRKIIDSTVINNKLYYSMVAGTDTSYYRSDGQNVWLFIPGSSESLVFKLNAAKGDSWQTMDKYDGVQWTVTLVSKTDTITINNHKIPNCYRYYFDIPYAVDDEHSVILAPGIGFIEENCGFCAYPKRQLEYAVIDGKTIFF